MIKLPNWIVHTKFVKLAGIDELIATVVNRFIDYGSHYSMYDSENLFFYDENEKIIDRQLKYFYLMDKEKKYSNEKLYIKAYYLHHLLDYFTETRVDINNIEVVFKKFLENKVMVELSDDGKIINFRKEIEEIFQVLRDNIQELYDDLKGKHLIR